MGTETVCCLDPFFIRRSYFKVWMEPSREMYKGWLLTGLVEFTLIDNHVTSLLLRGDFQPLPEKQQQKKYSSYNFENFFLELTLNKILYLFKRDPFSCLWGFGATFFFIFLAGVKRFNMFARPVRGCLTTGKQKTGEREMECCLFCFIPPLSDENE